MKSLGQWGWGILGYLPIGLAFAEDPLMYKLYGPHIVLFGNRMVKADDRRSK
jgi:hypothetical protein